MISAVQCSAETETETSRLLLFFPKEINPLQFRKTIVKTFNANLHLENDVVLRDNHKEK